MMSLVHIRPCFFPFRGCFPLPRFHFQRDFPLLLHLPLVCLKSKGGKALPLLQPSWQKPLCISLALSKSVTHPEAVSDQKDIGPNDIGGEITPKQWEVQPLSFSVH